MWNAGAIKTSSIFENKDILFNSSGYATPIFIDVNAILSDVKLFEKIMKLLIEDNIHKISNIDIVCGVASGGLIPAWLAAKQLSLKLNKNIGTIYIKFENKIDFSSNNSISGLTKNQTGKCCNCLVIDDVVHYSRHSLASMDTLIEYGIKVRSVGSLVTYENPIATKNFSKYEITHFSFCSAREIIIFLHENALINNDVFQDLSSFIDNPSLWRKHNKLP